jgi:hypothetical protein
MDLSCTTQIKPNTLLELVCDGSVDVLLDEITQFVHLVFVALARKDAESRGEGLTYMW